MAILVVTHVVYYCVTGTFVHDPLKPPLQQIVREKLFSSVHSQLFDQLSVYQDVAKGTHFVVCAVAMFCVFSVRTFCSYWARTFCVILVRKKHKDSAKLVETNEKLGEYSSRSTDHETIRADCLFTAFLLNRTSRSRQLITPETSFRKCSQAQREATNYACAQTKTAAIMKGMAEKEIGDDVSSFRSLPFSVATDASNDVGNDAKLYPIVVTFCD